MATKKDHFLVSKSFREAFWSSPGLSLRKVIKARVPWDKISSFTKGVIAPLKDKGSQPEIVIEIRASSVEGFDRSTLDNKVKETLKQIGAKIEEWKEE